MLIPAFAPLKPGYFCSHHSANFLGEAVHFPIQAVYFFLDPIQASFYSRHVVAVAAGLFEDMTRDHFLALDLAGVAAIWALFLLRFDLVIA
ncbi:MAG: hypothetical protein WA280_19055 [Xanthobacteraceae bacterium]